MIYRFSIRSEEKDNFLREIEINSDATFLEFNNIILDSVDYTSDEMTSFLHCVDSWEPREEITITEMFTDSDTDSYIMEKTYIDEMVQDKSDRLIFRYDMLGDRSFMIRLIDDMPGSTDYPKVVKSIGKAPQQISTIDELTFDVEAVKKGGKSPLDMDFGDYDETGFNDDEFDSDGFSSLDELGENY